MDKSLYGMPEFSKELLDGMISHPHGRYMFYLLLNTGFLLVKPNYNSGGNIDAVCSTMKKLLKQHSTEAQHYLYELKTIEKPVNDILAQHRLLTSTRIGELAKALVLEKREFVSNTILAHPDLPKGVWKQLRQESLAEEGRMLEANTNSGEWAKHFHYVRNDLKKGIDKEGIGHYFLGVATYGDVQRNTVSNALTDFLSQEDSIRGTNKIVATLLERPETLRPNLLGAIYKNLKESRFDVTSAMRTLFRREDFLEIQESNQWLSKEEQENMLLHSSGIHRVVAPPMPETSELSGTHSSGVDKTSPHFGKFELDTDPIHFQRVQPLGGAFALFQQCKDTLDKLEDKEGNYKTKGQYDALFATALSHPTLSKKEADKIIDENKDRFNHDTWETIEKACIERQSPLGPYLFLKYADHGEWKPEERRGFRIDSMGYLKNASDDDLLFAEKKWHSLWKHAGGEGRGATIHAHPNYPRRRAAEGEKSSEYFLDYYGEDDVVDGLACIHAMHGGKRQAEQLQIAFSHNVKLHLQTLFSPDASPKELEEIFSSNSAFSPLAACHPNGKHIRVEGVTSVVMSKIETFRKMSEALPNKSSVAIPTSNVQTIEI